MGVLRYVQQKIHQETESDGLPERTYGGHEDAKLQCTSIINNVVHTRWDDPRQVGFLQVDEKQ